MNIFYTSIEPEILDKHRKQLEDIGNLNLVPGNKLSEQDIIKKLKDADILVVAPSSVSKVNKKILNSLPKLKFITTVTTGYDWIDVKEAARLGIKVSTVKGANAESVAEHTWAMILDLAKRVTEFDRDTRFKGASDFTKYKGLEVCGKTLGVLGLGDIGSKVAKIGQCFDMKVLGFNRSKTNIEGVKQVSIDNLIKESDVISVNLPLTPETKDLINQDMLGKAKDNVIVVNTAREEIVNKEAIIEALSRYKVFGYGLETEIMKPLAKDDPYLSLPNIVVNPHNAFNTAEADIRVKETWFNNIISFVKGKPINVVN